MITNCAFTNYCKNNKLIIVNTILISPIVIISIILFFNVKNPNPSHNIAKSHSAILSYEYTSPNSIANKKTVSLQFNQHDNSNIHSTWDVYPHAFEAGNSVLMAFLYLNSGAATTVAAWLSMSLIEKNGNGNYIRISKDIKKSIVIWVIGILLSVASIISSYFSYWGIIAHNPPPPLDNKGTILAIMFGAISLLLFIEGTLVLYFSISNTTIETPEKPSTILTGEAQSLT